MLSGETRLVGLVGNPVAHSLSPRMQNAAFAARALDWVYVPLRVDRDGLVAAVTGLAALGFSGANVTIPYKSAVVALCDEVDPAAEQAGSVNTLVVRGRSLLGSSTDGETVAGLAARTAAVIGAGGAAKAVARALEAAGTDVRVYSRDGEWPPHGDAELVVNATPVRRELLLEPRPDQHVVDLAYNTDGSPTALVEAARDARCRSVRDGLDALVRQGAASFERWTGVPAPVDVMRAALPFPA